MKTIQKKINDNELELTVELGADDLKKYIDSAELSLGRDLEIQGFRKGKAPQEMIRDQIGIQKILETAMQGAISSSLAEALEEQKLDVLDTANLSVKENSPEKLVYSINVSLFPEVKLADLNAIKVKRNKVMVSDSEVDETIASIKNTRAKVEAKDAPAAEGDRVEIDFEVTTQGKAIEGGVSKNHPVVIGGKQFIPGFEDQLIGMKKDDQKTFSLVAPLDYHNKDVAGKELDFSVKMGEVKKVTLPEVNDEFARTLGKFDNVNQLLVSIREGLSIEKDEKEKQRVRLEILDRIISDASISVPEKLVSEQIDLMIRNFDTDLHRHDMELGIYLARVGKTQDDLRKDWKKEAERQVKIALVLHRVAKEKNITISDEEVNQELEGLVQQLMMQNPSANPNLDIGSIKSRVITQLTNEKVLQFLELSCVISL